jgi:dienelactone hydrolase
MTHTAPRAGWLALSFVFVLAAAHPALAQVPVDPSQDGSLPTRSVKLDVTGVKGEKTYLDLRLPSSGGPFPVVLISPGWAATTKDFEALAEHLASRGFAAALFEQPHNWSSDMEEWAHELSRGADALESANADASSRVAGALDLSRLAVVGHSYGGAAAVSFAAEDARVKACVALAPVSQWHKDDLLQHASDLTVPLLVEAGGSDWLAGLDQTRGIHDRATKAPARAFVEIKGGDHNLYQDSSGSSAKHAVAIGYLTAWLERFLAGKDDPDGWTTGVRAQADRALSAEAFEAPVARPVVAPDAPAPRTGFVTAIGQLGGE